MQRVKILSVTDLKGKPKDERIWGDIREAPFIVVGSACYLYYIDELKARVTSNVVGIQETVDPNVKEVITLNSVYKLEFLESEEVNE